MCLMILEQNWFINKSIVVPDCKHIQWEYLFADSYHEYVLFCFIQFICSYDLFSEVNSPDGVVGL